MVTHDSEQNGSLFIEGRNTKRQHGIKSAGFVSGWRFRLGELKAAASFRDPFRKGAFLFGGGCSGGNKSVFLDSRILQGVAFRTFPRRGAFRDLSREVRSAIFPRRGAF